MKLGKYNKLRIVRKVDFGLYLQGDYVDEILLPTKYVTADMHIGDEIEVFIYLDQEERPVATTLQPTAQVGDFAYLSGVLMGEPIRCLPLMGTGERRVLPVPRAEDAHGAREVIHSIYNGG